MRPFLAPLLCVWPVWAGKNPPASPPSQGCRDGSVHRQDRLCVAVRGLFREGWLLRQGRRGAPGGARPLRSGRSRTLPGGHRLGRKEFDGGVTHRSGREVTPLSRPACATRPRGRWSGPAAGRWSRPRSGMTLAAIRFPGSMRMPSSPTWSGARLPSGARWSMTACSTARRPSARSTGGSRRKD